jgi:N6-L-threonylcarbamoyladenine synthase
MFKIKNTSHPFFKPSCSARHTSHMQARANIAASFQHVAIEQLAQRVRRGIDWARQVAPNVSCLVVSGGVAANEAVRCSLSGVAAKAKLATCYPPVQLCTDNGTLSSD